MNNPFSIVSNVNHADAMVDPSNSLEREDEHSSAHIGHMIGAPFKPSLVRLHKAGTGAPLASYDAPFKNAVEKLRWIMRPSAAADSVKFVVVIAYCRTGSAMSSRVTSRK